MNTLPSQPQHYSQDPLQYSQGGSLLKHCNLFINRNPPLPLIISAPSEPLSTILCKHIYSRQLITAPHTYHLSAPNSPTNLPPPSSQPPSSLPHHGNPDLDPIPITTIQQENSCKQSFLRVSLTHSSLLFPLTSMSLLKLFREL
ncbi:hypothetical protein FGO68_gene13152 [Halteria grandinella]|uniref:Uncharacterized protein n=1 Tax=Halteria grandinella TaxID=5974 RepID=A0A8J8NIY9_HALGN|nr:hypothetical protein FGO68_gene13152 [Halteria grandinella]